MVSSTITLGARETLQANAMTDDRPQRVEVMTASIGFETAGSVSWNTAMATRGRVLVCRTDCLQVQTPPKKRVREENAEGISSPPPPETSSPQVSRSSTKQKETTPSRRATRASHGK